MISHGACGKTWTGLRRAHCAACCTTFNSDSAAEKHRVGRPGIDRRCVDPATVGLIAVEQPWGPCWQAPGSDLRFTANADAEAA